MSRWLRARASRSPSIQARISSAPRSIANGTLRARASAVGSDTALAQIVQLVQEAQNSKAPGQRLADRAAFWLVLVALIGGVVTLLVWLAVGESFFDGDPVRDHGGRGHLPRCLGSRDTDRDHGGDWVGRQARDPVQERDGARDRSPRSQVVVMDKTGTLTKGEPEVAEVIVDGIEERELLRLASAVERESEHPLAEAVVRYADTLGVRRVAVEGFENVPGHGARAKVEGHLVAVGNRRLMQAGGVNLEPFGERTEELATSGQTTVIVAIDAAAAGLIAIADAPRPTLTERGGRATGASDRCGHAHRRQRGDGEEDRWGVRDRSRDRRGSPRRQGREGG